LRPNRSGVLELEHALIFMSVLREDRTNSTIYRSRDAITSSTSGSKPYAQTIKSKSAARISRAFLSSSLSCLRTPRPVPTLTLVPSTSNTLPRRLRLLPLVEKDRIPSNKEEPRPHQNHSEAIYVFRHHVCKCQQGGPALSTSEAQPVGKCGQHSPAPTIMSHTTSPGFTFRKLTHSRRHMEEKPIEETQLTISCVGPIRSNSAPTYSSLQTSSVTLSWNLHICPTLSKTRTPAPAAASRRLPIPEARALSSTQAPPT
jgi:hypothetical protein